MLVYVWNHETYRRWYECIGDDASDKAIEIMAKFEINIRSWGTQRLEGLLHLIKELELNK